MELCIKITLQLYIKRKKSSRFKMYWNGLYVIHFVSYRLHDIMSEKTADQSTETSAVGNQSDSSATQIMDKLIPINANASIIKISKKMENAFPVVLLPGIESRLADFSRVANELRGQIWGVNYSHDAEIDTIEKESHFCLQVRFSPFLYFVTHTGHSMFGFAIISGNE